MSYLESLAELTPRDMVALASIGRAQGLTAYQLRTIHFSDAAETILFRRIKQWQRRELVHAEQSRYAGSTFVTLRPDALDALRYGDIEPSRMRASDDPLPEPLHRRVVLTNDIATAIGDCRRVQILRRWEQPEEAAAPDLLVHYAHAGTEQCLAVILDLDAPRVDDLLPRVHAVLDGLEAVAGARAVLLMQGDRRALSLARRTGYAAFAPVPEVGILPGRQRGAPRLLDLRLLVGSFLPPGFVDGAISYGNPP